MSYSLDELRYPIGQFEKPEIISTEHLNTWKGDIAVFPSKLKSEVIDLTTDALNWVYRPQGWTIQQVVHHCADSHMNALMRLKLTLTEEQPAIRPYEEARWAMLADTLESPIEWSLQFLEALHLKWIYLLDQLDEIQLGRTYIHPEHQTVFDLRETIGMYAWHCNHHLAHVRQAIKHQGVF
ncbi:putative metal-dependent hydrolase [Porifericola rhodea]|uniref:YfiT family bacillithiol transferase n=1 Tax=Porifericola rhodea TaxID=930972 RepID=UPI002666044B|nr:putative metal-dependent hydrolase [Porifericola rhodea]WKN33661.1 putative metal-dependent hydrolase [Porifericola rhodea]